MSFDQHHRLGYAAAASAGVVVHRRAASATTPSRRQIKHLQRCAGRPRQAGGGHCCHHHAQPIEQSPTESQPRLSVSALLATCE